MLHHLALALVFTGKSFLRTKKLVKKGLDLVSHE
jgi:hypothetical protein